jgi:hypothetical protein
MIILVATTEAYHCGDIVRYAVITLPYCNITELHDDHTTDNCGTK